MPGLVSEPDWSGLTDLLPQDQVLLPGTEAYSKAGRFFSILYL